MAAKAIPALWVPALRTGVRLNPPGPYPYTGPQAKGASIYDSAEIYNTWRRFSPKSLQPFASANEAGSRNRLQNAVYISLDLFAGHSH
jgi:hypothetical protein